MSKICAVLPEELINEIPKSCSVCPLGEKYGCVGDVKCRILGQYFTGNTEPPWKDRPDECPLGYREGGTNKVAVRWHDGYLEEFDAEEVRFGSDLLFIRLSDGKNRHIPLRSVRWFGMSKESHQSEEAAV